MAQTDNFASMSTTPRFRDRWMNTLPRSRYRYKAVARGLVKFENWRPPIYGWDARDSAGREIVRQEWVGEKRIGFRGALSGSWTTFGPMWGRSVHFGRTERML